MLPALLLLVAAGTGAARAQDALADLLGREAFARYVSLEGEVRRAFAERAFAPGLDALRSQMALLEKAAARGPRGEAARALLAAQVRVNWYNQACCLSRLGRKKQAMEALGKAVAAGFTSVAKIEADPDLDAIRKEPGYLAILRALTWNDVVEVRVPEGLGEAPAPLLVVLHPRGGSEKDLLRAFGGPAAKRGMVLAAPRGPLTLGEGRYGWRSMRQGGAEETPLRKVLAAIPAAERAHPVDPRRVYLLGVGEGGMIAALAALRRPDRFRGVVLLDARWPRYEAADLLPGRVGEAGRAPRIALAAAKGSTFLAEGKKALARLEKATFSTRLFSFDAAAPALSPPALEAAGRALSWLASK